MKAKRKVGAKRISLISYPVEDSGGHWDGFSSAMGVTLEEQSHPSPLSSQLSSLYYHPVAVTFHV